MAANIERNIDGNKPEGTKKWLTKKLQKAISRPNLRELAKSSGFASSLSLNERPRTAPPPPEPQNVPPMPAVPCEWRVESMNPPFWHWLNSTANTAPQEELALQSPVGASPLMGGIPHWRKDNGVRTPDTNRYRYATPIVQASPPAPATMPAPVSVSALKTGASDKRPAKSFRTRAKELQEQLPLLLRKKSKMSMPYESATQGEAPSLVEYEKSEAFAKKAVTPQAPEVKASTVKAPALVPRSPTTRTVHRAPVSVVAPTNSATSSEVTAPSSQHMTAAEPTRRGVGAVSVPENPSTKSGIYSNAADASTPQNEDSTERPQERCSRFQEEEMTSGESCRPVLTHESGVPNPHVSRSISAVSTSSFGCVDGMNEAQREVSRQRAIRKRGFAGKLRKLAENFAS